jgi:PAS domain S-box-containing protein
MKAAVQNEIERLRAQITHLERELLQYRSNHGTDDPDAPGKRDEVQSSEIVDHTGFLDGQSRVLDSLIEGVCMADELGYIRYTNRAEDRMLGYEAGELIGKHITVQSPYSPEETTRRTGEVVEQLSKEGLWMGEWLCKRKDGTQLPTSARIISVVMNGKKYWVRIQLDITDKNCTDQALSKSEVQLRVIDGLPGLASYVDRDFRFRFTNRGYAEWFGRPITDFQNRTIAEVLGEDWFEQIREYMERVLRGESVSFERSATYTDQQRWVRITYIPDASEHGYVRGMIVLVEDITGQKQAQNALSESEQRLRLALDAGAMGSWEWTFQTGRVIWSPNLEVIHGLRPGAFPNTFEAVMAEIHPEDRERVKSAIQRTIESRQDFQVEYRILRADSKVRWLEGRGRLLFDMNGVPERMVGICSDITGRRQQEESLRQTQKLESLGVLAGGIAHDFNNLLTGILGNASLATKFVPPEHPAGKLLDEVIKASQRAAGLTRQLLDYAGKGRFLAEHLAIGDLIRETAELLGHALPKKVLLHLDLLEDLPLVEGDASQIHQVIMNLVINAAEAMGERGGSVYITTGIQPFISDGVEGPGLERRSERYVTITVRDTGCGMDEATKARIFDPFFTTKFTGRGLGLAAVLGIIRSHKGALRVDSNPGKGSAFTILLPAATSAPVTVASEEYCSVRGDGAILVVDDEAMVRLMAKNILEEYGYRVLLANDGADALRVVYEAGDQITLVLLDLMMPVMDGDETLTQLQEVRPDIPVILSTGYAEEDAAHRFAGRKLASFLQKPYSATALTQKLRNVLGKH